jgi:hypothetical protein
MVPVSIQAVIGRGVLKLNQHSCEDFLRGDTHGVGLQIAALRCHSHGFQGSSPFGVEPSIAGEIHATSERGKRGQT